MSSGSLSPLAATSTGWRPLPCPLTSLRGFIRRRLTSSFAAWRLRPSLPTARVAAAVRKQDGSALAAPVPRPSRVQLARLRPPEPLCARPALLGAGLTWERPHVQRAGRARSHLTAPGAACLATPALRLRAPAPRHALCAAPACFRPRARPPARPRVQLTHLHSAPLASRVRRLQALWSAFLLASRHALARPPTPGPAHRLRPALLAPRAHGVLARPRPHWAAMLCLRARPRALQARLSFRPR